LTGSLSQKDEEIMALLQRLDAERAARTKAEEASKLHGAELSNAWTGNYTHVCCG